jgi:class 3 adenylate cyclase
MRLNKPSGGLSIGEEMKEPTSVSFPALNDIHQEFLKYAPAYAQVEARDAIDKVFALQVQGVLRDGVYYIVLVDLVDSTKYAAKNGNKALSARIETFVRISFEAFNAAKLRNIGLFVKEIGDAVLFIFHHFPDVLRWRSEINKIMAIHAKLDDPIVLRTCIHIGEVSLRGVNPLSIAVSHTFKLEKSIAGGTIGLSEPAYTVAWPTLARAYHAFKQNGTASLDGYPAPVQLFQLVEHDEQDLERMVIEESD